MSINDLTIGEARELAVLFGGGGSKPTQSTLGERYIGKYVICRTRNEGVNSGKVIALDNTGVILEDARRLYEHKPVETSVDWYEGVAKYGISENSKLSTPIEKIISEDYSLTVCTEEAEKSLREKKSHAQG